MAHVVFQPRSLFSPIDFPYIVYSTRVCIYVHHVDRVYINFDNGPAAIN